MLNSILKNLRYKGGQGLTFSLLPLAFGLRSLAFCLFFIFCLLNANISFAANYSLEIIQPRAGLDTRNRFYKAYPGLEYNVRVAVIGGAYPFTYSLTTAPSGMTINASTGEITWPNPTTANSPHSVSVSVTDQENSTATVSWTITVTTSGFRFIDAVNGNTVANGGTGTISNPWRTIRDMYEGNDYASKTKNSYANEFLYFRGGTYFMDGFIEVTDGNRVAFVSHNKPLVWLAYPGEAPILDMSQAYAAFYAGQNNVYVDGFTIENMTFTYGIQIDSDAQNVTFRNNIFRNLPTSAGSNNQAAIRISRGNDNSRGNYWSIQDNIFHNIRHGYGVIAYGVDDVLVEDNLFYDISDPEGQGAAHAIGPKRATSRWFIRHNNIYNVAGDGIWVAMYSEPALDIEISFNRSQATNALFINQSLEQNGGTVYVYRNTFEGNVKFGTVSASTGPYYVYNNVIVNNTSFTDHIECISCSAPSRLIRTNNLSGYTSNNIVDSNGNLTPAYSSYLGTHGYQIDATAPTVEITGPTKESSYTTSNASINLSGNANDPGGTNIGIVSVSWSNDKGGSGNCTGTTIWACNNISLQSGQNIITITTTDGDGKTGTDILVANQSNTGDTQAPSVPTGLLAQANSSSQINLTWAASTDDVGVTGYRIYRDSVEIATSTITSYSNTGLSPSTNYSYTVSAYDATGNNSAQSSSASATTSGGGGGAGGGDASSSGGSGCGFVKDSSNSNKVSESQSVRVTDIGLVIMLIISFMGISIIKKLTGKGFKI